jgi:hypothetical protein
VRYTRAFASTPHLRRRTDRLAPDERRATNAGKRDVAADPSDPLLILAAGLPSAKTMGDLGRPSHDADEAQCANCYLRLHEFQRLTGAVERAAHVDVPPLKPVLVAEIAGDTQELAAWGDHVPVVRVAPYLFGLGGAQQLSHASEGYPRWPGPLISRPTFRRGRSLRTDLQIR